MVITVVADVLGKANNGTTITILRLIESLKARGHEVRVVSPTPVKEEGFYCLPRRNFFIFNEYLEKNGVTAKRWKGRSSAQTWSISRSRSAPAARRATLRRRTAFR